MIFEPVRLFFDLTGFFLLNSEDDKEASMNYTKAGKTQHLCPSISKRITPSH